MKDSVGDIFFRFNAPFEGVCLHPYLDVKGIVTTGVGNALFSYAEFRMLPWTIHGKPATEEDMKRGWDALKAMPKESWQRGGGWFAATTSLRLTNAAVEALVKRKLGVMVNTLKMRFSQWDAFPADAQLGILSMAWAMGPHFNFPMFIAHMKLRQWDKCAEECKMTEVGNPGVKPRNEANRVLFMNAYHVERSKEMLKPLDKDKVFWPHELGKPCDKCGRTPDV